MDNTAPVLLMADDDAASLDMLVTALGDRYALRTAIDGPSAWQALREAPADLVLLDVVMPGIDGFEVCRRLKGDDRLRDIPVIFLTARTDEGDEELGLELGAVDYITKPFNPGIVKARVRNHLELKDHRTRLEGLVRARTIDLEDTREAAIAGMAFLAEYRDPETGAHIQRTKRYVRSLAETLAPRYRESLTPEVIERLFQSAPLHDIGKVGMPDAILLKETPLTEEEFSLMKRHTLIGGQVIRRTEAFLGTNTFLRTAREIAEFHHERWDGTGYPHGLKGEEIPMAARLMALADVYDALVSRRPYKPPYAPERAFEIITAGSGRTRPEHFAPHVLEAFSEVYPEWVKIGARFSD